jgi:hypothetical protein
VDRFRHAPVSLPVKSSDSFALSLDVDRSVRVLKDNRHIYDNFTQIKSLADAIFSK